MRILPSFVAILVFAFAVPANAQTADASDYYPLAVGNEWTYFLPYPGVDTLWDGTFGVDTLMVRDTTYFLARHPFSFSDTLRDDGNGRILARLDGRELILFDFNAEDGATYQFERSLSGGDDIFDETFDVTVSRERTVKVGAGHFEHCVSFYFDVPEALDDEHFWTFAPGVGIVKAGGFVGAYTELFSAIVDGKVITSRTPETPPETTDIQVSTYPNPFGSRMTISFSAERVVNTTATLFDVTGRLVREMDIAHCGPGRCVLHLDRDDLSPGVYFVVVASDRDAMTAPVTIVP
jgi:hypothetical protein